jgi:hypothetical protein
MKYALNLAEDGRILSVTFEKYAPEDAVLVDELPEGNVADYRYVDGAYVYDPIPVEPVEEKPSQLDIIEAQLFYTAMQTDTLLEV